MATTIQQIELPKKARAVDTSSGWQTVNSNLTTNGDFATGDFTGWSNTTQNSGAKSIVGGAARLDATAASDSLIQIFQDMGLVSGKRYRITFTITNHNGDTSTSSLINNSGSTLYEIAGNGVNLTFDFTHSISDPRLFFRASNGSKYDIDNITVLELQNFPNNNHGQIYSGRGLEFDGVSDHLSLTQTDISTGAWTVAAWIYTGGILDGIADAIMHGGSGNRSANYISVRSSNKVTIYDHTGGAFRDANTVLNDNTWYRVLWVYDGAGEITFYVNGVADGTGVIATSGINDDLVVQYIGTFNAASRWWNGMLSDFQAWDTAWTAADVTYDYLNPESLALNNSGTALTESNLKLWYPMQDGHRGQQSYILDGANTGLGDEILLNADFSINEPAAQTYLNGGLQFDNWVENQNSGLRKFTLIPDGVRCDILEQADTAWNTRLYSDALSLTEGQNYRFTAEVRCSVDGNFNAAIEAANGNDAQPYPETPKAVTNSEFSLVSDTFNYTPDSNSDGSTSSIVAQFYPNYTLPAGEFYEVRNISVKAINDKHHATTVFYGDELVTNGTFETNTTGWTNINGTTFERNTSSAITGDGDLHWAQSETDAGYTGVRRTNANTFVAGRTYVVTFTYRVVGTPDVFAKIGNGTGVTSTALAGYTEQQLNATSNTAFTYSFVSGASGDYYFMFRTNNNHASELYVDNVSIKEVGVASGWTDADQQLHIPQTALQSYNELAWFDGEADYVTIADHDDLSFDAFSVSAWINMNDATNFAIASKGVYNSTGEWLFITEGVDKLKLYIADESVLNCLIGRATAALTSKEGEWLHVVGTYDGGTASSGVKVYVNGVQSDEANAEVNPGSFVAMENLGGAVKVGMYSNHYSNGSITETSLWDKELSSTEVLELFNDGKALDALTHSATANIKGYWRNNGLSTWTDLKGSNNGTPTNITETILIPQGVDSTRDAQGFIMNRQKSTSCLNLTNEAYVDSPTGGFVGTSDFSVSCWFKTTDSNAWLLMKGEQGGGGKRYALYIHGSNYLTAEIDDNSTFVTWNGSATVNDGDWHHAVVTFDRSGNGQIYLDGSTDGSATSISSSTGSLDPTNHRDFTVGVNSNDEVSGPYTGQVDGVLIYTKALSLTEVEKNYNATKGNHRN